MSQAEYDKDDEEPKKDEDILKILVATDIHLGYNEKDPIRGDDSFNSFEEILRHAVSNDVDFVLLGGDLFHENKPSVTCYHRCISLLKKYCLGDKAVPIEFLSDQSRNFGHLKNPIVNYEDPNMNISIPVFSIHGNHDDPTGEKQLSAMDIIADTGFINYFGKWTDLNQVEIYPMLMRKGQTKIAIYGLSHIKDERLSRLFRDKKVSMIRPQDEGWFNILVLHQNRAQNRGIKNYIPEAVLPAFIDLVIWGHEHDCRLEPEPSSNGATRISQPGSSVATSLAIGESITKNVGLLHVHKDKFMMSEIRLNTVRPFVFKEITLIKPEEGFKSGTTPSDYGKTKIINEVTEMLEQAKLQETDESPELPLIRLVVNFSDESMVSNQIRLGQDYTDKVANPLDMFSFKVKKVISIKKEGKTRIEDLDDILEDSFSDSVAGLCNKYFESKNMDLNFLTTNGLCEAVSRYVDKNDTDAFEDIYKHQLGKTFNRIMSMEDLELTDISIDNVLEEFRLERANKMAEETDEINKLLDSETRKRSSHVVEDDSPDEMTDMNTSADSGNATSAASSSRGAAAKRRGRGARGPRRGRAKAK